MKKFLEEFKAFAMRGNVLDMAVGVVIGGASLAGGEGSVLLSVVGILIMAVIGNIMNLVNIASYPQMVVKAVVIILAVVLKSFTSKKRG